MKFKYDCEDGEVELLIIDKFEDVDVLKKGTPRLASACSFRVKEITDFSTGQIKTENSPSIVLLAESKYSLEPNLADINAIIGVTCVSESDRLIEVCLTRLHVGELGQFAVVCKRSKSSFVITLELVSLHESPEIFDLGPTKVNELGERLKQEGVKLFTDGFVLDAFYKFSQAFKVLTTLQRPLSDDTKIFISNLQSNMANCHVKFGNWESAIDLCNSVLDNDGNNLKALYRRGWSFIEIQEFEKAGDDLQKAQELEPGNQAVKSKIKMLEERKKALDEKYAQAMKKFFA